MFAREYKVAVIKKNVINSVVLPNLRCGIRSHFLILTVHRIDVSLKLDSKAHFLLQLSNSFLFKLDTLIRSHSNCYNSALYLSLQCTLLGVYRHLSSPPDFEDDDEDDVHEKYICVTCDETRAIDQDFFDKVKEKLREERVNKFFKNVS